VTNDLDTLLIALYVEIDDESGGGRCMGRPPLLSDSELVCLAVAQALEGVAIRVAQRILAMASAIWSLSKLADRLVQRHVVPESSRYATSRSTLTTSITTAVTPWMP
jgi:hypothetical protein